MSEIWDAFGFTTVLQSVPDGPLPKCNRGSWYCPVATPEDANRVAKHCQKENITTIYDLGAGTLEFSVDLDHRGYDVVAYESLEGLTDFALKHLPENNVEVRNKDYYSDWQDIRHKKAAFVALGKLNRVPGKPEQGIVVDGMNASDLSA